MNLLIKISILVSVLFHFECALVRSSELVGLVTFSRHGQRTPIINIPNDTRKIHWPVGPGQLLNSGKNLHFELGKWFRKRYRSFLPKTYSPKDIHVQSTDVDRVLMSSYCNLAGLYPPKGNDVWRWTLNWQPIPVHVMPGYYLNSQTDQICSNFGPTWRNYVQNDTEIFNEDNKKLYQYISKNLGVDVISSNPMVLTTYYDTLYTQQYHGYKLPKWAKPVFSRWGNIAALLFQSQTNTTDLARMSLGGFAKHLINHFDSIINSTSNYKYSMNFGHDINVAGLLNIMTNSKAILPFYGSSLFLEMYKNRFGNKYYVKLFFKDHDKPKEVRIKGCGFNCDYKTFRKLLSHYALTENEWKNLCEKKHET